MYEIESAMRKARKVSIDAESKELIIDRYDGTWLNVYSLDMAGESIFTLDTGNAPVKYPHAEWHDILMAVMWDCGIFDIPINYCDTFGYFLP